MLPNKNQYRRPTEKDFQTPRSLGQSIIAQQRYVDGPRRSTQSINNGPSNVATTHAISDILQGTMSVRGPEDTLLVINKALSGALDQLYDQGIGQVSRFSTVEPTPVLSQGYNATTGATDVNDGGSDGPAGGRGYDGSGSQVKESWVSTLPLNSTEGALIWIRSGKASREMHLPTSGDINTDTQNHQQSGSLPQEYQHPFYMDRNASGNNPFDAKPFVDSSGYVRNWEGGENIIGSSGKTVGNEDPNLPGTRGAYSSYYKENGGFMIPEHEQYYCSMGWPCKGVADKFRRAGLNDIAAKCAGIEHKAYYNRRVLVYSKETKRAVVCVPGDWGPNPYNTTGERASITGFIIGLAPDVHQVLGTTHGSEVMIGFMPDNTPVGPYQPLPSQALTQGTGGGGTRSGYVDVSQGTVGATTIDDLKYAGAIIANHPNFWMGQDGHQWASGIRQTLLSGSYANLGFGSRPEMLVFRTGGVGFLFPSLLNYLYYLMEDGGFILDGYLGSIGYKPKASKAGNPPSNHSFGGAIDFSKIGLASEGKVYHVNDTQCRSRVGDKLFEFLASLPKSAWADEHGCQWVANYSNGMRTYRDPSHIHFGFAPNRFGTLISALRPRPAPINGQGPR